MSLVRFYENRRRYADLVNGYLFHGEQVVTEEDIKELDSRVVGEKNGTRKNGKQFGQVYRDMVRKLIFGMNFAIIAIENQNLVHYAMPIRILYGEALTYQRQVEQIQKRHREKKNLKAEAEFLGSFSKEDRIPSVISLVIYYGEDPWDGAADVYDLLDMTGIPEEMKSLVNHYPIHILDVHRFENTERFQTDIREVFEFIQCANDKEKLKNFIELRKDKLKDMEEDACDVIEAITNTQSLSFRDERYRSEKGGINMCKALEDWGKELEEIGLQRGQERGLKQGREQGLQQGLQQGREQGLQQGLQITSAALFKFGVSVEEFAMEYGVALEIVQSWYDQWKEHGELVKAI